MEYGANQWQIRIVRPGGGPSLSVFPFRCTQSPGTFPPRNFSPGSLFPWGACKLVILQAPHGNRLPRELSTMDLSLAELSTMDLSLAELSTMDFSTAELSGEECVLSGYPPAYARFN